jgi:hypothetical protein
MGQDRQTLRRQAELMPRGFISLMRWHFGICRCDQSAASQRHASNQARRRSPARARHAIAWHFGDGAEAHVDVGAPSLRKHGIVSQGKRPRLTPTRE